ncbi:YbhB/YbcL family Raf kinase inhibitor-like protein [Sulfurovum sp. zt1-1]|uniref:YbhB/YbcL family Raf kinase inhibitor-like protein n=1 Tax=Sulfurovum zhangzhouensis TaxID=3019067 RepID=A0ABT7QVM5_9BACT|nr:YbhB/YbcL family Raf kinase inhibitor-like protein [Sulfurovum zhangzhouensis]MDM5270594.1 YbhB/YbcL family Raf kinase inhibitor-like protein [Sulfurovum zhangzhouensis]
MDGKAYDLHRGSSTAKARSTKRRSEMATAKTECRWRQTMKKRLMRSILAMMVMIVGIMAAEPTQKEENMALTLTSDAFTEGGEIPAKYTCEGADISPPLFWQGIPEGTKSLVLIVDDPDAPDPEAPKMTWVHWVLYNLPPSDGELPEGTRTAELPTGTLEGVNDWKRTGFGGPCPPIGRHRYYHKLYALDIVLPDLGNPVKEDVEAAMQGHIIAQSTLMGTYKKAK